MISSMAVDKFCGVQILLKKVSNFLVNFVPKLSESCSCFSCSHSCIIMVLCNCGLGDLICLHMLKYSSNEKNGP